MTVSENCFQGGESGGGAIILPRGGKFGQKCEIYANHSNQRKFQKFREEIQIERKTLVYLAKMSSIFSLLSVSFVHTNPTN